MYIFDDKRYLVLRVQSKNNNFKIESMGQHIKKVLLQRRKLLGKKNLKNKW